MANIGGNIKAVLQEKTGSGKNAIGEAETSYTDRITLTGWLGLQTGDIRRTAYFAKIEESTHVFLCDFHAGAYALQDKDTRMIIKGCSYDVKLIDNPDEMGEQLEIYLKKVGGQNG